MGIPLGGSTISQETFDAGYPKLYIKDRDDVPAFTKTTTLDGTITAAATTLTFIDTGFLNGEIFLIDDEKIYIVLMGIDPIVTTVVRGVDGTVAAVHLDGAAVCKVAEGVQLDAAVTTNTAVALSFDSGVTLAVDDVLRAEFSHGGNERMIATVGGASSATVIRDLNLDKELNDIAYTYLDNDILIVVATGVKTPYDAANLASWFEIESKGGVTITEETTTIETQSDQRGFGQAFLDVVRFGGTLPIPFTDPKILQYFNENTWKMTSNTARQGRALNYVAGVEMKGFQLAIVDQGENGQIQWIYDAMLSAKGDVNWNNEHRMVELTLSDNLSKVYNCYGNDTLPLPCA